MTIHIEISRSYKAGHWKLRIGDVSGSIEMSNISMREVLQEIRDEIEKEAGLKCAK